jgi:hypothetical protein
MNADKQSNPPLDTISDDSGPPLNGLKEPTTNRASLDIDDAQIEEPKDGAFKKAPQKEHPPKKRKKTGSSGFD